VKRLLLLAVKLGVSLGILGYLVWQAASGPVFPRLWNEPKHWGFLVLATLSCGSAVCLTMIRWCFLARALGLDFPLRDALRFGFLGYLFNLAPMGIAGGDLLKGVMLARQQRGQTVKSFASVAVDRAIGLYMLFVVAAIAMLLSGFQSVASEEVAKVCWWTYVIVLVGAAGLALMLLPRWSSEGAIKFVEHWPYAGPHLARAIESLQMYRQRPDVLILAAIMSVGVHVLFATGVYCVSRGLPLNYHSLAAHYVIAPLSASAGVLPVPMGPFELCLETFYRSLPTASGTAAVKGEGTLVALGYRVITLGVAAIGVLYYLTSRRQIQEALATSTEDDEQRTLPVHEMG